VSTQPQLVDVLRRPAEPDLVERIANALPKEIRADYYREMQHCRVLPETDEMLRILRAMQFLALLIQKAPGEVAVERERLMVLLNSAVDAVKATHRASQEYQQQLENRLAELPNEIVDRIDPGLIAQRITEALEQRLNATGMPETAQTLTALSRQMGQATSEFVKSAGQLASTEARVADSARLTFEQMQTGIDKAGKLAETAAQRLSKAFVTEYKWSVLMLTTAALVVGFTAGFFAHEWTAAAVRGPQAAAPAAVTAVAPATDEGKAGSRRGGQPR
jgi:hypothetical protein